jgi:hypothetical protein
MAEGPAIRSGFMLPAYVREIADTHLGLRALRVMISALLPAHREDDALNALDRTLMPLAQDGTARLFRLWEGDYLMVFQAAQMDAIRATLVRLRFMIPDDPLAPHFNDPPDSDSPLMEWHNLEEDFDWLQGLATTYETEAKARAETQARRDGSRQGLAKGDAAAQAAEAEEDIASRRLSGLAPAAPSSGAKARGGDSTAEFLADDEPNWRPFGMAAGDRSWTDGNRASAARPNGLRRAIDADTLDRLVNSLARADLSNHVRHQSVCALVGSARPQPLFSEIYVSITELRDAIAPRIDLMANRWLFQYFTETLDRRVLSWLNREGSRLIQSGFSININVETILSEQFLKFEQMVAAGLHGTVVLELRIEDIFSDLEAFVFARDFVRQRGYRLCLDFATAEVLAAISRERLGLDMVKLFWHPGLEQELASPRCAAVLDRLRAGEGARTVLARCDDQSAIEFGRSLGISMYQGRAIDAMNNALSLPESAWT